MWKEAHKSTVKSSRDGNDKRQGGGAEGMPGVIFLLQGKQMIGRTP